MINILFQKSSKKEAKCHLEWNRISHSSSFLIKGKDANTNQKKYYIEVNLHKIVERQLQN